MRTRLLPLLLASAITLTPAHARADGVDRFVTALLAILVVGTAAAATTEVLTGVATYKNYRSWKDERDPAAGWVALGGVGGLFNLGIGAYLIVDGLPSTETLPCPSRAAESPGGAPPPTGQEPRCTYPVRASAPELVAGTLMTGFGAFSVAMAIQAARTDARPAPGQVQPGSVPVGFMLPPLRF